MPVLDGGGGRLTAEDNAPDGGGVALVKRKKMYARKNPRGMEGEKEVSAV